MTTSTDLRTESQAKLLKSLLLQFDGYRADAWTLTWEADQLVRNSTKADASAAINKLIAAGARKPASASAQPRRRQRTQRSGRDCGCRRSQPDCLVHGDGSRS